MEVLDEHGELLSWISDDPDDFNSFSDYEFNIMALVHEYNEQACEIGVPLLHYYKSMHPNLPELTDRYTRELASMNSDDVQELADLRKKIKWWAEARLNSRHPDEPDEPQMWEENFQEERDEYERTRQQDVSCAFTHLHYLATHGEKPYQQLLADAYEKGDGVEQCLPRADYWRQVASANPDVEKD